MNRIIVVVVAFCFLGGASVQACTKEEFKKLDDATLENYIAHKNEKMARFEQYLQQIKIKKNLSDKELFAYRTQVLKNPKVERIHNSEPQEKMSDYLRIAFEKDCKALKNLTDKSMASADKQWVIVFEYLERELN